MGRLEQMIIQESKVVSGQVGKRSDDVSGLGWGNVKTGFVSKKKLGFLQREMSMEREASGSPVPGARARGLRVTFADSPNGSRPGSTLGWAVGSVADMDIRAQTPPLAGEWAVATTKAGSQMASSQNHLLPNNLNLSPHSHSNHFLQFKSHHFPPPNRLALNHQVLKLLKPLKLSQAWEELKI